MRSLFHHSSSRLVTRKQDLRTWEAFWQILFAHVDEKQVICWRTVKRFPSLYTADNLGENLIDESHFIYLALLRIWQGKTNP